MKLLKKFYFLIFLFAFSPVCLAQSGELISPVIPNGQGVHIHFTNPKPGEMQMLAESGVKWVRMDFHWSDMEKQKGQYDFTVADQLVDAVRPYKIKILFILDYYNPLYDEGKSPFTEEGRQAFAHWAAAGVQRYAGRGILWEMYNEPNIGFWTPKPNVKDYIRLALTVGNAIGKVAPEEAFIGPAVSELGIKFIEACFKAGLLNYWSAVSFHPYRQTEPETAVADFQRLRRLIDRYAPKNKTIPILSSEWGYSDMWNEVNIENQGKENQGKFVARQFLSNLMNQIPLSIWYDWHDDGVEPKNAEHHFGWVYHTYHPKRDPVYDPKPAFHAVRTFTSLLGGFQFQKRMDLSNPDDYILLFNKDNEIRIAAWTKKQPHQTLIPINPGTYQVFTHTGEALEPIVADSRGLSLMLKDGPLYLVPQPPTSLPQKTFKPRRTRLKKMD